MPDTIKNLHSHISALQSEVEKYKQSFEDLQHEKLFSEKVLDSLPGIFYLYDRNNRLKLIEGLLADITEQKKQPENFAKKKNTSVRKIYDCGTISKAGSGSAKSSGKARPCRKYME